MKARLTFKTVGLSTGALMLLAAVLATPASAQRVRFGVSARISDDVRATFRYDGRPYVGVRYDRGYYRGYVPRGRRHARAHRRLDRDHERYHRELAAEHARLLYELRDYRADVADRIHWEWHEEVGYDHEHFHADQAYDHQRVHRPGGSSGAGRSGRAAGHGRHDH